jgi:hypothetical protein
VADLDREESDELGGVLRATAAAVEALMRPEQVYVTLWSHSDATPQHIHWVVQPVTREVMIEHGGLYGPRLQVAMFERGAAPSPRDVGAAAGRLRTWFAKERP